MGCCASGTAAQRPLPSGSQAICPSKRRVSSRPGNRRATRSPPPSAPMSHRLPSPAFSGASRKNAICVPFGAMLVAAAHLRLPAASGP